MQNNLYINRLILAAFYFLIFAAQGNCKTDAADPDRSAVALRRNKTEQAIHQIGLYTIAFIADNDKFPDMGSPLTVRRALLEPYAKGDASNFVDAFNKQPFKPNPSLSNRPENIAAFPDLPAGTIVFYQAKPLLDGSRCVFVLGNRGFNRYVSSEEWRRLLQLPLNRALR